MRLVVNHVFIEGFPEEHQLGSVQMPLVAGQRNNVDRPIANVLLQGRIVPFDVVGGDLGENVGGVSAPRPTFELPSLAHDETGHDSIPVRVRQLVGVVDDSVRNGQTAFFPPLNEQLIFPPRSGGLFIFGAHES